MSTQLDIELVPETLALINEFGKTVTLIADGSKFGATGSRSSSPSQQVVKATPPDPSFIQYIPGDTPQSGETAIYVAAQGLKVTIKSGLKVLIDGVKWTVVGQGPVYTGDDIAMYGMRLVL